jgi:hypothetical protein
VGATSNVAVDVKVLVKVIVKDKCPDAASVVLDRHPARAA